MKNLYLLIILFFSFTLTLSAQEILITETGQVNQVNGKAVESESLLPFNDLNIEFGYVLYQTEINVKSDEAVLELENVRDYAVVFLNDILQSTITDNNKKLAINTTPGKYSLKLYTENIGRITYGPEILDNSKGLFGSINLNGVEIENWIITPLLVKDCDVNKLQFEKRETSQIPCFHRGYFEIDSPKDIYLDISGWGMGEVWINGNYIGSYWEEEKQQSIQIPASNFIKGKNQIIIFELKNNQQKSVKLVNEPVFQ